MASSDSTIDPAIQWLSGEQNIALMLLDNNDSIVAINPAAQNLLGYSQEQIVLLGLEGLGIKEDARLHELLSQPAGSGQFSCQLPVTTADGGQRGFVLTAFRYADHRHFLAMEAIGEKNLSIAKSRENEERYRLALEAAGIGTWDMDIRRNETRRTLLHDQCFGYSELQPSWSYETFLSHIIDQDRERVDKAYRNAMEGGKEYDLRFRVRWPDQSIHWLWSKGRFYLDEFGNPTRVAGIQADVTEEVTLREELRYKATHDYLTGLWNREFFEVNLTRLIDTCRENGRSVAVILIDIDHFKRFNDAFNHAGGDQVLKAVSDRIRQTMSPDTMAARFGGDEFVLAVPRSGAMDSSNAWIAHLMENLSQNLAIEQGHVKPTVSVGVSFFPEHGATASDLLKASDSAMYEAKRCGRATFREYDPATLHSETNTLMLADSLPNALASGEIQLFYQPQFEVSSHRLVGMEALLRWFPDGKLPVPPDVFVTAAEQSGFISVLGDWVIKETCRQIREWKKIGLDTVPVAINVSSLQFMRGELTRSITRYLDEFQLPGNCLELEITESIALDNLESALGQLHEIRRLGLTIAVDDFGTGFSSLSYLRFFPIDRIKIDRAFVTGCMDIKENAAICQAVIVLAHNLGCRVIAEGVEHLEQLNFLAQQGCEEIQGYLFARPMPEKDARKFLEWELGAPEELKRTAYPPDKPPISGRKTIQDAGALDEKVRQQSVDATKEIIIREKGRFQSIVEMAARSIGVPMAALNIVEKDCVSTVVPVGMDAGSFERSTAFCNQTIHQTDVLTVGDASVHPYFKHNPAVAGHPGIKFYAGFGLLAPTHQIIGTLCLFDTEPRELNRLEEEVVSHFGSLIEYELARLLEDTKLSFPRVKSKRDFGVHVRSNWRLAARSLSEVALIWFGIDELKKINAAFGIEVGDLCITRMLAGVASVATDRVGIEVFRMEGDSVVVFCQNASMDRATEVLESVKQELEYPDPSKRGLPTVAFRISFGVHVAVADGTIAGMEQFLRESRRALETGKKSPRSKIQCSGSPGASKSSDRNSTRG